MTRDEKQRAIMAINVDLKKWREIENGTYEAPVLKKGVCYYIPEYYLCMEYKSSYYVSDEGEACPRCPMTLAGILCAVVGDCGSKDSKEYAKAATERFELVKKWVKEQ